MQYKMKYKIFCRIKCIEDNSPCASLYYSTDLSLFRFSQPENRSRALKLPISHWRPTNPYENATWRNSEIWTDPHLDTLIQLSVIIILLSYYKWTSKLRFGQIFPELFQFKSGKLFWDALYILSSKFQLWSNIWAISLLKEAKKWKKIPKFGSQKISSSVIKKP